MATNNAANYKPTQYNVQTGGASGTLNNVAPSATSGVPIISQGTSAQPVFGTAVVAGGGTGLTSTTAYAVLCGGTTSTGALQSIAGVGTSGQVLTSNGAGALPTFQAAGGGGILSSTTVITSAQVKALVATPITLVAAQGAGTYIQVLAATAKLTYGGSNAFVYNGSGSLVIRPANTSTPFINTFISSAAIAYTTSCYCWAPVGSLNTSAQTVSLMENGGIVIANTSASEITGNAGANNTITVVLYYTILSI